MLLPERPSDAQCTAGVPTELSKVIGHRRAVEQLDRVSVRDHGRGDAARRYVGEVEDISRRSVCADVHITDDAVRLEGLARGRGGEFKRAAVAVQKPHGGSGIYGALQRQRRIARNIGMYAARKVTIYY